MVADPSIESRVCPHAEWHDRFDMTAPAFGDDFDEIAVDLVEHCPVARTVDGEYVVSRYADVKRVLLESDLFSSGTGIRGKNYFPKSEEMLRPNEMDQPEHAWLRHSWDRFFTKEAIAVHESEIRRIIDGLIDTFLADGEVDLVAQFADPLSCRSFCQAVANMPVEDMPFLQRAFQAALTAGSMQERTENWIATHQYVSRFLEQRRSEPRRDDIVDAILHFEYPDGRPFSMGERASALMQVTAAGLVTTGAVVTGAVYHLASHPEDRDRLVSDRSLIPRAIEEFLRIFVPAPMVGRRLTGDTELAGVRMTKGDFVWYNLGGANRDPAVIDRPEVVDLYRESNRHLTFATGRHRCLGPEFARMNIRVALEQFLDRVPDFQIQPGFQPHFEAGMTRRMTSLPLTFDAPGSR
ncbi:hypothetical protein DQ238_09720 [Geodermatophilus sp. TF02-6]|nr:hypothetical protein DQ238_09720 [Geodermatophilus sp. TF02-6]